MQNRDKFLKRAIGYFILLNVVTYGVVYLVIDPYGLFKLMTFVNETKVTSHQGLVPFVLAEKLSGNKYVLVFGNSRSAKISKKMLTDDVLNFANSINARPIEIANFLNCLSAGQAKNIKNIYYQLDARFDLRNAEVSGLDYNSKIDFSKKIYTSLNYTVLKHAWVTIRDNFSGVQDVSKKDQISEYGYALRFNETSFSYTKRGYDSTQVEKFNFSVESMAAIKKIDEFCREHGVEAVYYFSSLNKYGISKLDLESLADFQIELLKQIDFFYDMYYIKKISEDVKCSIDFHHMNTESVGEMLSAMTKNRVVNNRERVLKNIQFLESVKKRVLQEVNE